MDVQDFINSVATGNAAEAKDTLNNLLSARAFEALETKKIEIAQTLFGGYQVEEEVEELDEATMTGITLGQKVKNKQGGYNQDVHHKGEKIGHIEAYKHRTGMRYGSHHDASGDGTAGNRDAEESIADIRFSHAQHLKDTKVKKEQVEQIDEKNVPTSPEKWAQAKSQAKAKFDVYPSAYANGWAAKKYKAMGGSWKSVSEATDPPFDKPYTTIKKVVTDKSGAKHSPMSRARDIARMAMKKQMEKMKPVKESLEESRKAEIVKEIMKKKKDKSEDAFQKDPELTTTLTKGI